MAIKPGKFVWFEHVSTDPAKARAFYTSLFGWTVQDVPMGGDPYPMLHNGGTPVGGLRGDAGKAPPHWACWMSVAAVDATVGKAERAGAKMLMPPTDFSGMGRGAVLQDPQGAVICIWRSASGEDAPDEPRTPVGGWCWTELMTGDDAGALAFYESVFGYTHDVMPMPQGSYYILKTGDVARAGLMRNPEPMPSYWMPYVEVADADACVAKAKSLGGKVYLEPHDIDGVGRIAILGDTQGAAIGVIRSAG